MTTPTPSNATSPPNCPTHAVCPPCREGWGHYTPGRGYSPTVESERLRNAYDHAEWRAGFAPYDWPGTAEASDHYVPERNPS